MATHSSSKNFPCSLCGRAYYTIHVCLRIFCFDNHMLRKIISNPLDGEGTFRSFKALKLGDK